MSLNAFLERVSASTSVTVSNSHLNKKPDTRPGSCGIVTRNIATYNPDVSGTVVLGLSIG